MCRLGCFQLPAQPDLPPAVHLQLRISYFPATENSFPYRSPIDLCKSIEPWGVLSCHFPLQKPQHGVPVDKFILPRHIHLLHCIALLL
ncbi:hypothetical protein D3C73_996110 [compost metagenome]